MGIDLKRKEGDIKKAIFEWLKIQPSTFVWVNHTTGVPDGNGGFRFNSQKGIADICGVKSGRAFAFEVKTEKGKANPHQEEWLKRFDGAGGYACIVRSLGDAQEAFLEIK